MIIEKPSRTYAWFHDVTTQDIEVNRGEGIGAHKVLAGSPIDENGNVANDETAIGLLMETVSDANPDGKIIVAGDVDALGAKNASGIELSDAAKNALIGITWREPDYVVEMQAGGGWPADLPKPSAGGYGYTEQGEQTVITWDGDTEGREFFVIGNPVYKVSNKIITQSDVIGGEYSLSDGTTVPITEGRIRDFASSGIEGVFGISFDEGSQRPNIMCVQNDIVFADTNISAGVYFLLYEELGYVSSLTYGTPDTVHKIDEKYLPESGGVMVVTMTVDENNHVISPYTPEEVITAMQTMPVYCVIESTISPVTICGMFMMKGGRPGPSPILRMNFGDDDMTVLSADSEGWVFSV